MSSTRSFKHKRSAVSRLWDKQDYKSALAEVEAMLKVWPGNAHLHVLWANLVQLQEQTTHSLDEARQALRQANELAKGCPMAAIELAHFLDAVDDAPRAAAKVFSEAAAAARQLLIEALIGQAKALLQLDRRPDALRCLLEVLQLNGSSADRVEELLDEVIARRSA